MTILILDKKDGKLLTEDELAIRLYKEGANIVYCDIEGVGKIIGSNYYYLLDECGNNVWLDPERFEVNGNGS